MGFRIGDWHNVVPARVTGNRLYCDLLLDSNGIEIPIEGIEFPEQFTHFLNKFVCAYLKSGEFEVVLRFNGTGCLVQNGILRRSFTFKMPDINYSIRRKGSIEIAGVRHVMQHIILENGSSLTFVPEIAATAVIPAFEQSVFAENLNIGQPILTFDEDQHLFLDEHLVPLNTNNVYCSEGFKFIGGNNIARSRLLSQA